MPCRQETWQRPYLRTGVQTRKMHMGKCSCLCIWNVQYCLHKGSQRKELTVAVATLSQGCIPQSPVQATDGPVHSTWSQPNTDPMGCRSAPGKNSGYAAWKPELCSSSAHSGPTTRITLSSVLFSVLYTKGLADLNQNGPIRMLPTQGS